MVCQHPMIYITQLLRIFSTSTICKTLIHERVDRWNVLCRNTFPLTLHNYTYKVKNGFKTATKYREVFNFFSLTLTLSSMMISQFVMNSIKWFILHNPVWIAFTRIRCYTQKYSGLYWFYLREANQLDQRRFSLIVNKTPWMEKPSFLLKDYVRCLTSSRQSTVSTVYAVPFKLFTLYI